MQAYGHHNRGELLTLPNVETDKQTVPHIYHRCA